MAMSGELTSFVQMHVVMIAARERTPATKPRRASRRMAAAAVISPAIMQGTTAHISFRYLAHPVSENVRVTVFF